jgi:ergothioneine biosynthesis protein EgtB
MSQATRAEIGERFTRVRSSTEMICEPLSAEDAGAQSMPDASPAKWHLAHTSWFFDAFVIAAAAGSKPLRPEYNVLFNSYYDTLGPRIPREARGLLTRPSLASVLGYRRSVTEHILGLLDNPPENERELVAMIELGVHHEEQHQELILTDIKHLLAQNPMHPAYRTDARERRPHRAEPRRFRRLDGGLVLMGACATTFSFDNEGPRHQVLLQPYELAEWLVTNVDYLEFIQDGGYDRPELWLSDGFAWKTAAQVTCPLYWQHRGRDPIAAFTLRGDMPLEPREPVCHVSYYEADAFARWASARLPSEAEWEHAARDFPIRGNFLESGELHPTSADDPPTPFGDVWQWTASPHAPYPRYQPPPGALGEYNGKFMCNQMVLRGGSCVSPAAHIRVTYRNFFPPTARWQFSGIRLARNA